MHAHIRRRTPMHAHIRAHTYIHAIARKYARTYTHECINTHSIRVHKHRRAHLIVLRSAELDDTAPINPALAFTIHAIWFLSLVREPTNGIEVSAGHEGVHPSLPACLSPRRLFSGCGAGSSGSVSSRIIRLVISMPSIGSNFVTAAMPFLSGTNAGCALHRSLYHCQNIRYAYVCSRLACVLLMLTIPCHCSAFVG